MLLFSIWVISLLTLFRTISMEDPMWHNKLPHYVSNDRVHTSRTGRFGFDILDNLRKQICQIFCMSADSMQYPANLIFIFKCPEWYLSNCSKTTTPISTPISTPTLTPPVQTTTTSLAPPIMGPPSGSGQPTVGPIAGNPPPSGSNITMNVTSVNSSMPMQVG